MKRFLVLQLRPEDAAAEEEFDALLARGGLTAAETHRVRLDQGRIPAVSLEDYAGIIVGGGPGCVSDPVEKKSALEARIEADVMSLMPEVIARDMPYLGCCYGLGILAQATGGTVGQGRYGEPIGGVDCDVTEAGARDPLLDGLPRTFRALVGHKEAVEVLPDGARLLVTSESCPVQMMRTGRNVYATQFHPEADGESIAVRVEVYKDRGYFDPSEAAEITARARAEEITVPGRILAGFVKRYRSV